MEGHRAAKLCRRDKIQRRLLLGQKLLDCLLLTHASLRSDVADLLFEPDKVGDPAAGAATKTPWCEVPGHPNPRLPLFRSSA
jgi:hypothetical protein